MRSSLFRVSIAILIMSALAMIFLSQPANAEEVVESNGIVMFWKNPKTGQTMTYEMSDAQYKTIQRMVDSGAAFDKALESIIMSDDYRAALAGK